MRTSVTLKDRQDKTLATPGSGPPEKLAEIRHSPPCAPEPARNLHSSTLATRARETNPDVPRFPNFAMPGVSAGYDDTSDVLGYSGDEPSES